MTKLYFKHNGFTYVMATNEATGDRDIFLVTGGQERYVAFAEITNAMWDAASAAYESAQRKAAYLDETRRLYPVGR
jgi:hypothetical protein